MVAPLYAGFATHIINDPATGVRAYNEGDGLMADAIDNLGLQVGADYTVARPDLEQRPADSAPKAVWVNYAATQGMDRTEADDMSRKDLIALYPQQDGAAMALPEPGQKVGEPEGAEPPGANARKGDWVAWAVSHGADRPGAEAMTIAELASEYPVPEDPGD